MTMAATERERTNLTPLMILAWTWVTLPFLYGVYELIQKVTQLFTG
jgi:membrane protein insertase Oxa1/YidC/SpoIIIJ